MCFAGAAWSSCEEIPHVQGKRNPSKMVGVARGHQRADTLKPYSQKTNHSLVKLKETKPCPRGNPRWVGHKGNGKPLQYSCLENPMNSMKRQNDGILKEEHPTSVGAQYATGDQ